MRFELLSIPGISDVSFDSKAGTYYCYVYAITPLASTSLLSTVQDALNQTSAFPITGTAINPDLIGISLSTTLTLASSATQTDQQTAIAAAVQAAQNYINDLSVGQELVINDIADQILNLLNKFQEHTEDTRSQAARFAPISRPGAGAGPPPTAVDG